MNRNLFFRLLVGLSFWLCWIVLTQAQEKAEFRVMTYNVRYKNSIDSINGWEYRKANVAALVQYHNADVIGMQEANPDQVRDLDSLLPDYDWYGVPRVEGPQGEYTPIFYRKNRFECLESGSFWYSETPEVKESKSWDAMYPRIASWCRLKDRRSGNELFFFNTHFDHRGEMARQQSALVLRRYIDSLANGRPVIVTGDFNSTDTSVAYRHMVADGALKDALHVSATPHYGPVNTAAGFWVKKEPIRVRIDYIFVNDRVNVISHASLTDQQEGRYYSDHLPVIATVTVQ